MTCDMTMDFAPPSCSTSLSSRRRQQWLFVAALFV